MPVGTPVIHLTREQLAELITEYYGDRGSSADEVVWQPDGSALVMLGSLPTVHVQRTDKADHQDVHVVDDKPEQIGTAVQEVPSVDETSRVIASTEDYEIRVGAVKSTDWVNNPEAPRHKLDTQDRVEERRERMLRVQAEQEAEQALLDKGVSTTAIHRKYRRYADE